MEKHYFIELDITIHRKQRMIVPEGYVGDGSVLEGAQRMSTNDVSTAFELDNVNSFVVNEELDHFNVGHFRLFDMGYDYSDIKDLTREEAVETYNNNEFIKAVGFELDFEMLEEERLRMEKDEKEYKEMFGSE